MRRILFTLCLMLTGTGAWAAAGNYPLDHAPLKLESEAALQRGAQLFVNYCQGCHSAQYQRYSRFAEAAGLPEDLVEANLIFTPGTKFTDHMTNAMDREAAADWFGAPPPDLTLIARSKGTDYLYTYLRTFYVDESRPYGVNNAVFPLVGMPHVLWQLQGLQEPVYETTTDEAGHEQQQITGFELVRKGSMTPEEFDAAMADLVTFLAYIGEPIQLERQRIGFWVLLYLVLFFVVAYLLKKEYWKDVH
ncbi:MAG: cytochrome c1 [Candidatus Competibacterales bacterium]|nr:cytochrome c1 [Candidatus Competibacterales bacterium]